MLYPVYDFIGLTNYLGLHGADLRTLLDVTFLNDAWVDLGLSNAISDTDVTRVGCNRHPRSSSKKIRPRDSDVAAFLHLWTCDASISICAAIDPRLLRRAVMETYRDTTEAMLHYLSFFRDSHGKMGAERNALIRSEFPPVFTKDERESRGGGPLLHQHGVILNLTKTPVGYRALYPRFAMQYQRDIAEFGHLVLAYRLAELGLPHEFRDGITRLACVKDQTRDCLSSRHADIIERLKEWGAPMDDRSRAERARRVTAPPKVTQKSDGEMLAYISEKCPREVDQLRRTLAHSGPSIFEPDVLSDNALIERIRKVAARHDRIVPVRVACAVGRLAPGVIDPRRVHALVLDRWPAAPKAPWFVRCGGLRRVSIAGLRSNASEPVPLRECLPISTSSDASLPFRTELETMLESRKPVVLIAGSPTQIRTLAKALAVHLPTRPGPEAAAWEVAPKVVLVDGRRGSLGNSLGLANEAIGAGRRAVVFSNRTEPVDALNSASVEKIVLSGRARGHSRARAEPRGIRALIPADPIDSRVGAVVVRVLDRNFRRDVPSDALALARSVNAEAFASLDAMTSLECFRPARVNIQRGCDIAFRSRKELEFRAGRVEFVRAGRTLVLENGDIVDDRTHEILLPFRGFEFALPRVRKSNRKAVAMDGPGLIQATFGDLAAPPRIEIGTGQRGAPIAPVSRESAEIEDAVALQSELAKACPPKPATRRVDFSQAFAKRHSGPPRASEERANTRALPVSCPSDAATPAASSNPAASGPPTGPGISTESAVLDPAEVGEPESTGAAPASRASLLDRVNRAIASTSPEIEI